jgi:hypothetical protein
LDLFGDALLASGALSRDAHYFAVNAIANILRVGDVASVRWLTRLLSNDDYAKTITEEVRQDLIEKTVAPKGEAKKLTCSKLWHRAQDC